MEHGLITPAAAAAVSGSPPPTRRRSLFGEDHLWWVPRISLKTFALTFTCWVLVAQVALFVIAVVLSEGFVPPSLNATFGPSRCALLFTGGKFSPFIVNKLEYWRLISANFIHSGIVTLLISAILEYFLMLPVELEHGRGITIVVFFLSGLTGYTFSTIAAPTSVDTGALGPILGIVGFRISYAVLTWSALDGFERRRVGGLEACAAFVALIVGQSPYVDTYGTFAGFVIGCFVGGAYFAKKADAPAHSQRVIIAMAILALLFVMFVCAFLLGVGRFPLIDQVIWNIICQPPPDNFYLRLE